LIARHLDHPLRSLDALHLSVAAHAGITILATADAVMAAAGVNMGFDVMRF
jgi:predicted nucleic acid-binding protein